MTINPGDKITFRGCMWDDGWEFDAPCVIYSPVKRYGFGGNSGQLRQMVDSICFDLGEGVDVRSDWPRDAKHEFRWRGWSPDGFARRKRAWHVEIVVQFGDRHPDGYVEYEVASDVEWWGKDGRNTAKAATQ